MSVVGIGTDLVAIERIAEILARHRERFLQRCFHVDGMSAGELEPAFLAGRWAAKEAFLKALGADVRAIPYRDVEVRETGRGSVEFVLHGMARVALDSAGGKRVHLSLGRERAFVMASVLIED